MAAPGDEVVALDGTTARRSFDRQRGRRPLHLVSARAVERRLVPGQHKVGGASDEIEALPELLARLALDGRLVTADAMHCQKATARTILGRGGDHVRALKGNQPAPYEDVRLGLDDPTSALDDVCPTVDGDPGRIETRRAMVAHDVAWLAERHAFPASPRSPRSAPRARATARPPPRAATTCSPSRSPPPASPTWCAATGASGAAATGCSTG